MPIEVDFYDKLVKFTSPTVSVDAQTLHDTVEDAMATPEGTLFDDILFPEGKIEDPEQVGVFSQIILGLSSLWQLQFWQGSGYTDIYGGKIVGGVGDEVIKATGAAGDVTVLKSPVDGLAINVPTGSITEQDKLDIADRVWSKILSGSETASEFIIKIWNKISAIFNEL